ncbi:MAG TPA: FliM/FliN family flagellar motor C-terminal domain-containing protein [Candidatus Eisenbacteria bacterium]|nr:FliM/FliN family flagellar motor C-terminal domain-containing protein [Candidatus Eisenbacteria bacterium]
MSAAAAPAVGKQNVAVALPDKEEARWRPALDLSCQLTTDLALPSCKVKDFLKLRTGSVLSTSWGVTRDIPVRVNGILIGWAELEAVNNVLCVRITELA